MKLNTIFFIFLIVLISGCRESTNSSESSQTTSLDLAAASGCFMFEIDNSRILLKLGEVDSKLSGAMEYALEGKYFQPGTLTGVIQDDIFLGTYKFTSEGTESFRQVAFKRTATGWIEGFGPVTVTDDNAAFSDPDSLDFTDGLVYKEVTCDESLFSCIGASDKDWSVLKSACIDWNTAGITLNPIETIDQSSPPVHMIFSENRDSAEVLLPYERVSLILERKGEEGNHSWKKGEWEVIIWKGYVLRQDGLARYAGDEN